MRGLHPIQGFFSHLFRRWQHNYWVRDYPTSNVKIFDVFCDGISNYYNNISLFMIKYIGDQDWRYIINSFIYLFNIINSFIFLCPKFYFNTKINIFNLLIYLSVFGCKMTVFCGFADHAQSTRVLMIRLESK